MRVDTPQSARRTILVLACAIVPMCVGSLAVREPQRAHAQLPGSGYTFDTKWNCGRIYRTQRCWEPGTLGISAAHFHTYGWGSADYDGSGSIYICFRVEEWLWGACGYNLVRVCRWPPECHDQDESSWRAAVSNEETNGSSHTVYGHAKA